MPKLTNAQLTAQLESALVRANNAEAELARMRAEQAQPRRRPVPTSTEFQRACAKARELAMRTGKSVRVAHE